MATKQIATKDLWVEIQGVRRLAARAGQAIPPEFLDYVDEGETTPAAEAPPAVNSVDAEQLAELVTGLDEEQLEELLEEFDGGSLTKLAKALEVELDDRELVTVEVPDGVVPGETPGWPIDAVSGRVLDLPDQVRQELAKVKVGDDGGSEVEDISGLTVDQLKERLDERKVEYSGKANKEQLQELLRNSLTATA
jgi:hypothetical protein